MLQFSCRRGAGLLAAAVLAGSAGFACGDDGETITLYSGRAESLVGPLIERFEEDMDVDVDVRYAGTTELATLLLEEGEDTPADVFLAQDGGALGAVSDAGLLQVLPSDVLDKVNEAYRSPEGTWIGLSGRARVIVFNRDNMDESEVPDSIFDLTSEEWEGKVAWAPTNASFQAFVTLLRETEGDEGAKEWLEAMKANGVHDYENNISIVEAVAAGEVELGLVNHYYLWGFIADQGDDYPARNHFTAPNDPGSLVNVAGAGIIEGTEQEENALALLEYMLSEEGQTYFAEETYEYPLVEGVEADPRFTPLDEIDPPNVDLSELHDLEGTLDLLREAGVLQ